jgi:hypothetical protein
MTPTLRAALPDRDGEVTILGGGLSACLLAVELARATVQPISLHCGAERDALDHLLLVDRTSLLEIAHRLDLPEAAVWQRARPLGATYLAWETEHYAVSDPYVGLDGGKFIIAKRDLETLARRAAHAHGVRLCIGSSFGRVPQLAGSLPVVTALGRAAFRRISEPGRPRRALVNPYVRFICDVSRWTVDGAEAAHIVEAGPDGWLSVLPVSSRQVEIIYYTEGQHRAARRCVPLVRLAGIAETSPILSRLVSDRAVTIRSAHRGFTVAADHPAIATPRSIAVGDALFPHDPLAGQGVRFALWSTRRAGELLAGDSAPQDFVAFNASVAEVVRAYHARRCMIYGASRWHRPRAVYWRRQAAFSRAAFEAGRTDMRTADVDRGAAVT